MRVLFLSYEFPPLSTGGVHRVRKLVKHLPSFGIDLDVVTVRPEDFTQWSKAPLDATLLAGIPDDVRLHRISGGFPAWFWKLNASRVGRAIAHRLPGDPVARFWRRPLFEHLDRLVAERRPDVILATMPPFGVAQLAREAAARYRLPWVGDWRDPWTLWSFRPFSSYMEYAAVRREELAALRSANVSVATSHVTRDDWIGEFPDVDSARLVTIYNGWDPDEVRAVEPTSPPAGISRIVYVGSWYYTPDSHEAMMRPAWRRRPHRWLHYRKRIENWLYRSPYFFLRGLRRFLDTSPELARKLEVVFVGPVPPWLPAMLDESGTSHLVTLAGPRPHRESLELQAGATAVLLTSAQIPGGRDYSIAGKLFEYIGLRKQVLGVLADGAMHDMLVRTGLGVFADPDNEESVAQAIRGIVERGPREFVLSEEQERYIASLTREETARVMADQLRRAVAEGPLDP